MLRRLLVASVITFASVSHAEASSILSVVVDFTGEYLRSSVVTNNSVPGFEIVSITYSFGTPKVGVGTWDSIDGVTPNIPPGGVASDFLSDAEFFQTLSFNVNIPSDGSFAEGNALAMPFNDMDVILSLSPLAVDPGSTSTITSAALRNGFVLISFNTGHLLTSGFDTTQDPRLPQRLVLEGLPTQHVPEPSSLVLLASGAFGLLARLPCRKRAAKTVYRYARIAASDKR